ncbi:MAG TPA: magnesium/cobalt transporter CorA [Chloroflexota bacterium]|jgi:magnesium transporter|nr:magnesium/cobalt transporter CorA [Chloroflexota bacterium]
MVWQAADGQAAPQDGAAPPPAGMEVACLEPADAREIGELLRKPDRYLWLDLTAPTADELQLIAEEFSLHPLAVEDAAKHSQRPKIEGYENFYLMVVFAIEQSKAAAPGSAADENGLSVHEIDLFIGERFLISVHESPLPYFEEIADRWRHNQRVIDEGIGVLVYTILDGIVDAYFPILDEVVEEIEAVEEALFAEETRGRRTYEVRDLFLIKKQLLQIRRVVAPERDALLVLARQEVPLFDRKVALYFQDVYDHVVRLTEAIDVYQELLTNVLDSYLAVISNNLNQVMKTLTALTVILMVPTLIAGIYGMNFDHMPELRWQYGYPVALGVMVLSGFLLFLFFRRRGWI